MRKTRVNLHGHKAFHPPRLPRFPAKCAQKNISAHTPGGARGFVKLGLPSLVLAMTSSCVQPVLMSVCDQSGLADFRLQEISHAIPS
jgi:hypothetical protein